jgi:GNAT superfamily N-acetyltransferase
VDVEYRRHDGVSAKGVADELIAVYAEVYGVPPYLGDPFFSVRAFGDRLYAAFGTAGFEAVTASHGGRIVGYVHGATLPADRRWWVSLGERRPAPLRRRAEAGDVFWLRELMVLPAYTGQGLGHRLHDLAVAGRADSATVLTCVVGNQPAHGAYLRWGYSVLGRIRHAPESPVYDAMYRSAAP